MKNFAKAAAPAGVCFVAAIGMTGGFSPGSAFGPVVGTSAGTVGLGGVVGVGGGVDGAVEAGAEIDWGAERCGEVGSSDAELVQPTPSAATNAKPAIAPIRPTRK